MSIWILVISVFFVDLTVAFAWTECVKCVERRQAIQASLWAGFLTLLGGFTIINYTNNNWLLVPAVIGTILGTYLNLKYKKK